MGKKWEWQSDLQGKAMIGLESDTKTYKQSLFRLQKIVQIHLKAAMLIMTHFYLERNSAIPAPSSLCKAATY